MDDKVNETLSSVKVEKEAVGGSSSHASLEIGGENKNNMNEGFNGGDHPEQKPPPAKVNSEHLERGDAELLHTSGSSKYLPSENVDELKSGKADEMDTRSHGSHAGKQNIHHGTNCGPTNENQVLATLGSVVSNLKSKGMDTNVETGPECKAALQEVNQLVEQRLVTNGKELKTMFSAAELKIDTDFLYFLADAAVIAFQYGNPDTLCSPLVEAKTNGQDLVDAYAKYVKDYFLGKFGGHPCISFVHKPPTAIALASGSCNLFSSPSSDSIVIQLFLT
ncbi:putative serine protease EDA2 [Camellia lanceoleosa]|uniref:Serine protease EDA2 n=1 Tax=Camellia lanceoleosa TaxID=1840588 RepID=A0ACC0GMV6_9ERIC|nr:putative serine protease EDA2 [Camellia lanceoleosa]